MGKLIDIVKINKKIISLCRFIFNLSQNVNNNKAF